MRGLSHKRGSEEETGDHSMRKCVFVLTAALAAAVAYGQQQTSTTIEGQAITVKYAPPAAKNRIDASFHTDADLAFKGVSVPKGDYTVYVLADGSQWQHVNGVV